MSQEVQKGPSCFLNSFSEGCLGAAGSTRVPGLVNSLCLKDYIRTINPLYHLAKISKFSMLLITYRESVAASNLSASRSNLERRPYSMGDPGVQPAAVQWSSTGPGLSAIYGARELTPSHICIPTTGVHFFQTWLELGIDHHHG